MPWILGCLGLVFIVFGSCVIIGGTMAVDTDPGFATAVLIIGGGIVLLSIWMLYKAVTIRRSAPLPGPGGPGADPP